MKDGSLFPALGQSWFCEAGVWEARWTETLCNEGSGRLADHPRSGEKPHHGWLLFPNQIQPWTCCPLWKHPEGFCFRPQHRLNGTQLVSPQMGASSREGRPPKAEASPSHHQRPQAFTYDLSWSPWGPSCSCSELTVPSPGTPTHRPQAEAPRLSKVGPF